MSKLDTKMYGVLVASDFKKARYRALYWFMFACLVVLSAICIIPTAWLILSAFKDAQELAAVPPALFPKEIRFSKVVDAWNKMDFGSHFLASLSIILGKLAFDIGANGFAGYAISKLQPKGAKTFGKMVFWSMLMPSAGSMVITFAGFVKMPIFGISLMDSHVPLWILAGANAFNVLLFKSYFDSIDKAYMEAARIDGCTDLGIFFRIIVPLSVPLITTLAIFQFNAAWGEFLWPSLLIKTAELKPIAQVVSGLGSAEASLDKTMMPLMLMMLMPIAVFLCFQKKIMGGFNLGGIKG